MQDSASALELTRPPKQSASAAPPLSREIRALTGVRGVAALWVVVFHLGFASSRLAPDAVRWGHWPVARSGYLAVDLFFVLSGFVLAMVHAGPMARLQARSCGAFLLERALRVLPMNALVLMLFVAVMPLMQGHWLNTDPHDRTSLLACLLLVQQWGHHPLAWNTPAWSLSAEAAAYLAFPFVVDGAARLRTQAGCCALILALLAVEMAWLIHFHAGGLDQSSRNAGLIRCILGFTAGIVLRRAWVLRPPSPRAADTALIAGGLLLVPSLAGAGLDAFALPAYVLLIWACASGSRWCDSVFGNPIVHLLGRLSFALYLVHWLLIECATWAVRVGGWAVGPALACVLLAALPAAALLHFAVERPCHRLGRRLSAQWLKRPG